jgi:protein O-GlcNAc transferase
MLSLQQQHGGAVAGGGGGDARNHAPQPAVLGAGVDWLAFGARADLEEPARNAPSPALFLLPPAPLDDRAAQPEPKPKPGQLAGGDSSCKRFFSRLFCSQIVSVRVLNLWELELVF